MKATQTALKISVSISQKMLHFCDKDQ